MDIKVRSLQSYSLRKRIRLDVFIKDVAERANSKELIISLIFIPQRVIERLLRVNLTPFMRDAVLIRK